LFRLAVIILAGAALARLTALVFTTALLAAAAPLAALLTAPGLRPVPSLLLALTLRTLFIVVSLHLLTLVGVDVRHE
jgi:hypothetical protein